VRLAVRGPRDPQHCAMMLVMLSRFRTPVRDRLDTHPRPVPEEVGHDIPHKEQLEARPAAAGFVRDKLMQVRRFDRRDLLLKSCGEQSPTERMVWGFGVGSARSMNHSAQLAFPRVVHGFDSLHGLPEDWRPGFAKGTFESGGRPPAVRPNVVLHVDWFEPTLAPFRTDLSGPVVILHIDCDLYSSTKTVLDGPGDPLIPGTAILLDEYFNYPGWREHEHTALDEFADVHGLTSRFLAFPSEANKSL
jgi:hypothetical protein